jgi:light-regulated signal transduction histidine kinase (bacteriophytochrome)
LARLKAAIRNIIDDNSDRQLVLENLGEQVYYINVYRHEEYIYLEWELQFQTAISAQEMNEIGFLFERHPKDIWNSLCKAVQQLLDYDRVFVFNYEGHESGEIIAEYARNGHMKFRGMYFAASFMSDDIIEFYQTRSYRYAPNLHSPNQKFYTIAPDVDLSLTSYQPYPELHEHYIKGIGVSSVIIYAICVNDTFWGLLVGQNHEAKPVDMQKRKLASFIVQSAVNKYESSLQNKLLDYHEKMKDVELDLKGKLLFTKTINCALAQSLDVLCRVPNADGIILYHKTDIYGHGLCPSDNQVRQIVDFIREQPKRPVYKDNNFSLRHGHSIDEELPFAGLMALQIGQQDDHFLIWFRRERVRQVIQIDHTQRVNPDCRDKHRVGPYSVWNDVVYDTALPWNDDDLSFVINLDKLINDTIVIKAQEYQKFNEELIALNNELELLTFTLSHDLKNPLSVVKMGMQFLKQNENLPIEKQRKWRENIMEGVGHIEDIVNNILVLSSINNYESGKFPVTVYGMVRSICEEAKLLYDVPHCKVTIGKLFPILGEKSVLYQIFLNIIGNAVKYSSRESVPSVSVESVVLEGKCIYTISDNGIGIPADQLKTIFEVSTRASNSKDFEGTGFGLGLVKRIMDKYGGLIKISSEINVGTTVRLEFLSESE